MKSVLKTKIKQIWDYVVYVPEESIISNLKQWEKQMKLNVNNCKMNIKNRKIPILTKSFIKKQKEDARKPKRRRATKGSNRRI